MPVLAAGAGDAAGVAGLAAAAVTRGRCDRPRRGLPFQRHVAERVLGVVAVLRRLHLDVGDQRDEMQLFAVVDLHLAHGVTDRRQRPLRDLDRGRIVVDQIEAIEQLAAGILALQHVEFQPQKLAHAVLGRPHLRIDDLHDVAAGRQRLRAACSARRWWRRRFRPVWP